MNERPPIRTFPELCGMFGHWKLSLQSGFVLVTRRMHVSVPQMEQSSAIAGDNSRAAKCEPRQDMQLTARVKAALIAAGDVTAKQILIETANGVVSLSGSVDSEAMKQATLDVARLVCGAQNVLDQLVLRDARVRSTGTKNRHAASTL